MATSRSTATKRGSAKLRVPAAWDREAAVAEIVARPAAPGFGRRVKLAERVAAEIETRIIRHRWPTGHVIGSESELLETYGVSRAILREAIRILEHQSIAAMRKGPGGGLVVAEPSAAVVSRAMAVYFRHQRVNPVEMLDVRIAVESAMLELVHHKMAAEVAAELRHHLAVDEAGPRTAHHSLHHFHLMLAKMSGNPGIELFVQCLVMLTDVQASETIQSAGRSAQDMHAEHVEVAEALIRGDLEGAVRANSSHIRGLEVSMAGSTPRE